MIEATQQTTGTEGSGRQLVQQSPSSGRQVEEWTGHPALKPATPDQFRIELSGCLALVAPAGFDDTARKEWLRAAWATLNGIPPDLLARGCRVARAHCDHPSKIVPAIMMEVGSSWDARRGAWGEKAPEAPKPQRQAEPEPEYVTPEQAAAIMAEFGLRSAEPKQTKRHLGPPRQPTAEELAEIAKEVGATIGKKVDGCPSIAGLTISEIFEQRNRIRAAQIHDQAA